MLFAASAVCLHLGGQPDLVSPLLHPHSLSPPDHAAHLECQDLTHSDLTQMRMSPRLLATLSQAHVLLILILMLILFQLTDWVKKLQAALRLVWNL